MNEIIFVTVSALIKSIAVVLCIVLLSAAVSVYIERKVSAFIQNRIGPNRVGPFGTLQPIVDVIKLLFKEDVVPAGADYQFHRLGPVLSLGVAIVVYAVIPFSSPFMMNIAGVDRLIQFGIAPNINIGILYILAMTSVGVYGITLAGWSSNSKYSLLGGLRSSAQMISYELSMGLAIVGILMITGSFSMNDIVMHQQGWKINLLLQPLGFIIFLVSAFAETNRAPFDLPEAEPELVGGYNTEYTGMKFGMFFLAEYSNMAVSSAMICTLYFGGWMLPFSPSLIGLHENTLALSLVQFAWLLLKVIFCIFFFVWVRWSIPRFRYDQLMRLGWKVLLPLAIFNVVATAIVMYIIK
ncbi:MAG: NADH-quinone oxidoreductase subunit NuoH [Candidatus Kapabacteria bacterium]|nr:NADH-quinone oxidoreductase subunit NuoH [Candidatus Kapabacteria bacterium]